MDSTAEVQRAPALEILEKEKGLARQLSERQLAMIAIGGAIGTGLFLGSALAVRVAGPAVILSYVLGALVALLLMGTLAEMAVAHPTAGSFGVYAEIYVSRWAGFVMRYTYWASQSIAIGGEAVAVAIYCQWWWPQVPQWVWVVGFSLALVYINARSVGNFGEFEYWFSMIKVVAIMLFVLFGTAMLLGWGPAEPIGLRNLTEHGGFFPLGVKGAWMALVFVIFSYIGTEVVAVTAGEARDPQKAVPRAMRTMVARLILFYLGAITVLVAVVPWNQIHPGESITASPFVRVFSLMGVPAAAHIVNFVVLTAALSSMNCNLYLATRMVFSLARGGYAPAGFGQVSAKGTPVVALLVSAVGLLIATLFAWRFPESAYVYMFGIALFGGLFVWFMIFVTHLFFRRRWAEEQVADFPVRMRGYPYSTLLGAAMLAGILATTWWVEGMRITLLAGLPWLAFISAAYWLWARKNRRGV
ncbi:MAG TPA: amino acid permease [Terriglobales bacterium]|nr:amino acid permease [Terriglobales bacterium]